MTMRQYRSGSSSHSFSFHSAQHHCVKTLNQDYYSIVNATQGNLRNAHNNCCSAIYNAMCCAIVAVQVCSAMCSATLSFAGV